MTNPAIPTLPTLPALPTLPTLPALPALPAPEALLLRDGTTVISDFYDRIKHHVLGRLPATSPDIPKSLKQICCPDFWCVLSDGDRRTAGICVANMVANNELPLIHTPHKHEYPKKYRRI